MEKRKERETIVRTIRLNPEEKEQAHVNAQNIIEPFPELYVEEMIHSFFSYREMSMLKTYEVTNSETKGPGSVNDPRGGEPEIHDFCKYCGIMDCPGHYGLINFPKKIYNPLGMKVIVWCLTSVCSSCTSLIMKRESLEKMGVLRLQGIKRLETIATLSAKVDCTSSSRRSDVEGRGGAIKSCGKNHSYIMTGIGSSNHIKYTVGTGAKQEEKIKSIEDVWMILNQISNEDARTLGFTAPAHPRDLIMQGLLVIPPIARPPQYVDGVYSPDGLTKTYINIFRATEDYKSQNESVVSDKIFSQIRQLMLGGETKSVKGFEVLSIKARIQGKEALLRGAMMGKRGNFCGRTVAGPDPSLNFGEIGIPEDMASILTIEETVQDFNRERMTGLLSEGKITHITFGSGPQKGVQRPVQPGKLYNLENGDKVERWLQNGDVIIGNRQPSLHAPSMMGYFVRLGKHSTIRLHMSATTPLNMDFDGDEGNAFLPRSAEARAEAREVMHAIKNVMSTEKNQPTMALVYDSIVSAYLLTDPAVTLPPDVFGECLASIPPRPQLDSLNQRLERYAIPENSGRALFSALLPVDFTYRKRDDDAGNVTIVDGVLVEGRITKGNIGVVHGSIVQVLNKMYGQSRAAEFINDASFLLNKYLTYRGFTISIADALPGDRRLTEFNLGELKKTKLAVEVIGTLSDDPIERDRQERDIVGILDTTKGLGTKLVSEIMGGKDVSNPQEARTNSLRVMTNRGSGAKGSEFNIAQIMSTIGQQYYGSQRIKTDMTEGHRCLPHYEMDDLEIEARGYIPTSFMAGMAPQHYFFAQYSGREGSSDTSIKTADTGALSHEVVKAMEDLRIAPDGSVRNTNGVVFQPVYGGDGFDPSELLKVPIPGKVNYATFTDVRKMATFLNSKAGWVKRSILPVEVPEIPVRPPIPVPEVERDALSSLTKYERAQIIGMRVKELYEGNPPMVDIEGISDPFEIVQKELKAGFAPYIIKRYPPGPPGSGKFEEIRV